MTGALVRTLVDQDLDAGSYQEVWDGRDARRQPVKNGIYFYQLVVGGETSTGKMVFLR